MATKKAMASKKSTNTKPKASASSSTAKKAVAAVSFDSVLATLKTSPLVGVLVAEFLGTFLLTAAFLQMQGNPLFVAFALAGVVLIVGGVSKAHVNPAITVGAWATKKIDWLSAVVYVVAQVLGAAAAVLVLNAFLKGVEPSAAQVAAGATAPSLFSAAAVVEGKEWFLFFAELLGTSVLALGVATAVRCMKNRTLAAFAAGFAILAALYVVMSLTTNLLEKSGATLTFLNPAIALVANGLSWKLWPISIYVVAPVLGAVVGFVLHDFLYNRPGVESC